jgi:hypothetical protein
LTRFFVGNRPVIDGGTRGRSHFLVRNGTGQRLVKSMLQGLKKNGYAFLALQMDQ